MEKQQVLNKIAEAFDEEKFPRGVEFFIASANQMFDTEKALADMDYEKWDQIPLEVLITHRDRMTYFTEYGFRFMLPAFLTAAINRPKQVDVMRDNIIHLLIPPPVSETYLSQRFNKRAEMLSTSQAEAILHFFNAYTDIYPTDEWSFNPRDEALIGKAVQFWKSRTDISR
jgi:hypothetical protein